MKVVIFTRSAAKQLRKLPLDVQQGVEAKLLRYAETGAGDVKRLVGSAGARLRVGDYRAVFLESDAEIAVIAIGNRREIYS